MNNTANAASCANYCRGECDPAGTTCWRGSRNSTGIAQPSAKLLSSNGSEATKGNGAIGDRCTDCMMGQGRNCHCLRDYAEEINQANLAGLVDALKGAAVAGCVVWLMLLGLSWAA